MIKDKPKEFTYRLFDSYYSGLYIGYSEDNSNETL